MDLSNLIDYLKNGIVEQGRQVQCVLVGAESDLASLAPYGYEPGTIAHTAGFKNMWQLDVDGTWVDMLNDE